jgi:hypothetical protein
MRIEVPQHPAAVGKLIECITEPGWVEADEPDKALVGFVFYDRSLVRFFNSEFIQKMPSAVVKKLRAWRKKRGVIII